MGWGFWTQYYATMKENYNEYLTGYNTAVNGAAQHIIDLIDSQKDYGNDYVNQGMRYVGGLQQYLIDAQTLDIYTQANAAVATAYDDLVPDGYFALQQSTQALQVTSLGLQMQALALQLCQSYSYQTTGLFQRCVASSTASKNPLHELCYNFSAGILPSLAPMKLNSCPADKGGNASYPTSASFFKEADKYLAPYETINNLAQAVNCYVDRVLWGGEDSIVEKAVDIPFVALKVEIFNKTCTPFEPPSIVTNVTSCVASDCRCFASECDDDAVLKCFPASGAECQAFNATLEGGFAEDETCCVTRYETFNCTSPPQVEPTYYNGKLNSDGYTLPYITEAQFKNFSDPDSPTFGKLVIGFPVAYMRQKSGLKMNEDEVFVRGIAAYLEGATIWSPSVSAFNVRLTATGEMTNQVRKPGPYECYSTSCKFDDYSFAGAPSGESNPPSTVVYEANYWNWEGEIDPATGEPKQPDEGCGESGAGQRVFTDPPKPQHVAADSPPMYYCTTEDYKQSYDNAALTSACRESGSCTGPYNSASLFSSFELTVESDGGDSGNNWGIDLSGVTAIHIGFWLMTTPSPDVDQCQDMSSTACSSAFTDDCAGVNLEEWCDER